MNEVLDSRVLGALRWIDAVTQTPIATPLVVTGAGLRFTRNLSGLTVITHAAGLEAAAGQSYYQAAGDDDFHIAIAAASKSPRLLRALVEELYDVMRLYRFRSSSRPGRAREALAEHRAILAALRRRDPSAAEAAMRAHIRASWENTRANFQDAST